MNQSKIATRYAKAAFELALEKNEHDRFRGEMKTLSKVLVHNPGLSEFLNNIIIRNSHKIQTIEKIFSDAFSQLTMDFIRLVINNGREKHIPAMCRHIEKLYKQHENIHSIHLYTAMELDDNVKKKINVSVKDALSASKLEMVESVDKSIIGGFILRTEDFMYDASLKTQLAKVKQQLTDK
ncbi:MAG: ATP synthase F1 subunit delta [Bacteroidales bacterium]